MTPKPDRVAACPRGCVDTEGCGCEWNAPNESAARVYGWSQRLSDLTQADSEESAREIAAEILGRIARMEAALREIGTPESPGPFSRDGRLLAEWWQHKACKRGEIARDALGVTAEELIRDAIG